MSYSAHILTAAVDLKFTEDNEVKILEVEASHHAGAKGYWALTGLDMMEDVVYPNLRRHFNIPLMRFDLNVYGTSIKLAQNLRDGLPKKKQDSEIAGIFVTDPLFYINKSELLLQYTPEIRSVPIMNACPFFLGMASDKALFDFAIHYGADQYTPDSTILSRDFNKSGLKAEDKAKLLEFPAAHLVLKIPDESQHDGMMVVRKGDIVDVAAAMKTPRMRERLPYHFPREWDKNIMPYMIIQERVQSKPVVKEGRPYDGTMRVYVSAWKDPKTGNVNVMCHDAYWKLPVAPMSKRLTAKSFFSGCPSKLMKAFKRTNMQHNSLDNFALVDDDDKQIVWDVLENRMKDFWNIALCGRLYLLARDHLHGDYDSHVCEDLAIVTMSNGRYYDGNFDKLDDGSLPPDHKPEDIWKGEISEKDAARILEIFSERPRSSIARYLRARARGTNQRFSHSSEEFKDKVLKRLPRMEDIVFKQRLSQTI